MPINYGEQTLLKDIDIKFPDYSTNVDFVFCEHNAPSSLPSEFGELLFGADAVALETVGWSKEGAHLRQRVADGNRAALSKLSEILPHNPQGDFWRKVHDSLFNTKVQLHYPDAPQGHQLANEYIAAVQKEAAEASEYRMRQKLGNAPSPTVLLPTLRNTLLSITNRDRFILHNFFPSPEVMHQQGLRYVGLFGLVHRGLATAVARQASIHNRSDVAINSIESGSADATIYEKFINKIPLSAQDVVAHYNL